MNLIPSGTYQAKIVEADLCKSRAGKDMIRLLYEILDTGQQVFSFVSLQPQATWRLRKLLDAIGISGNSFDTEALHGRELTIAISRELFQGRYYNKVVTEFAEHTAETIQSLKRDNIEMPDILREIFAGIDENSLANLLLALK